MNAYTRGIARVSIYTIIIIPIIPSEMYDRIISLCSVPWYPTFRDEPRKWQDGTFALAIFPSKGTIAIHNPDRVVFRLHDKKYGDLHEGNVLCSLHLGYKFENCHFGFLFLKSIISMSTLKGGWTVSTYGSRWLTGTWLHQISIAFGGVVIRMPSYFDLPRLSKIWDLATLYTW